MPLTTVAWPVTVKETTPSVEDHTNDAAVRTILRQAARVGFDVVEAGQLCAMLGLSLPDALARAAQETSETG